MAIKRLKRNDLIYPELSYLIVGILFEVHTEMGYGYQEKYYQRALSYRLKEAKLNFQEQTPIEVNFDGNKIGKYFLDFLIDNKIALELKKGDKFLKTDIEQLYAYLKASKLKLGILVNFTKRGLQFKRIVNLHS